MSYSAAVLDSLKTQQHLVRSLENNEWDLRMPTMRMLHAAIGMAKESGELLDIIYKMACYNKPIDWLALMDELGDNWFYFVQALDTIFLGPIDKKLWACGAINQAKLKFRYPNGGFTESDAIKRDKVAEREEQRKVALSLGQFEGRIHGDR